MKKVLKVGKRKGEGEGKVKGNGLVAKAARIVEGGRITNTLDSVRRPDEE